MDGERLKWEKESRPLTAEVPGYPVGKYAVDEAKMNRDLRAFRKNVEEALESGGGAASWTCAPRTSTRARSSPPQS